MFSVLIIWSKNNNYAECENGVFELLISHSKPLLPSLMVRDVGAASTTCNQHISCSQCLQTLAAINRICFQFLLDNK